VIVAITGQQKHLKRPKMRLNRTDGKYSEYSWEIWEEDRSYIQIKKHNQVLFKIFVGEVIDFVGRDVIETHIAEIEKSPWIKAWHNKTK